MCGHVSSNTPSFSLSLIIIVPSTYAQKRMGKERVACAGCHVKKPKKMYPKRGHWKQEGGLCSVCNLAAATCPMCRARFVRRSTNQEEEPANKQSEHGGRPATLECDVCSGRIPKRREIDVLIDDEHGPSAAKKAREDPTRAVTADGVIDE
jgi:hypothetical protein